MSEPIRSMRWQPGADPESLARCEWIVANGLGGYASGTVGGAVTRRYHGLLVAALAAPLGRVVMLSHLSERVRTHDGTRVDLGGEEPAANALTVPGSLHLDEFCLDLGLPTWRYRVGDAVIEKRVVLPHHQNTVHVTYALVAGKGPLRIDLRPSLRFRRHEATVDAPFPGEYELSAVADRFEITARTDLELPALRMRVYGAPHRLVYDGAAVRDVFYRVEAARGYHSAGMLWTPGFVRVHLEVGRAATLIASTEPWEMVTAMRPTVAYDAERTRRQRLLAVADPCTRDSVAAELVLAADQYVIQPAGRIEDATIAHAAGDEFRSVIAGYHWFTEWGRDTMISLEGLTLATGRPADAAAILRTFARHVQDGLIPNYFPEGEKAGVYHTADATLWFFHALHRHARLTGDRETVRGMLPVLRSIVAHHLAGTRFGIGVDPADGLLHQGAEGYQLTWMDAKVDDWVVTPRRGKAVEINALWHNALRLYAGWLRDHGEPGEADQIDRHAARAYESFNRRFWCPDTGHLYDLVDGEHGDDPACRPNQIFAVSLDYPVLAPDRWRAVVDVVREKLLTPLGLRSLSADHPDYKARYDGDLRARDAAYHQGTVWAWLIGPYVDAFLRVHPGEKATARAALHGFAAHLDEACLGQISEIFDAEAPYTARGCIAQAWSVAEVLRAWIATSR